MSHSRTLSTERTLPIGAELNDGSVDFRVWAPRCKDVAVELGRNFVPLEPDSEGYFRGLIEGVRAGDRYRYRLDGGDAFADPASRYQPEGPHGASQVVDPSAFDWTDDGWRGVDPDRQIIYELHVGTFTREGTYAAAAQHLTALRDLGITTIELMPVAEFPGRFGWGYDGVNLFAPYHVYGSCDDLRAFVDRAHALGLAVVLDVVYNHLGPDGNYLPRFSDSYLSKRHRTDWGDAINFDGDGSPGVRAFVTSNVRHWIAEYHFDGLRLDATHAIIDDSEVHILDDIERAARDAAGERRTMIIAESEPQDARIVRSRDRGGYGLQQIWCDDFHHAAVVAATGRRESYFTDYRGTPQELISCVRHNVLYQGQRYEWQNKRRGDWAWDLSPSQCVFYLENHDQVANSLDGRRLHQLTSPGRYRALTALLLLSPQIPMLFQGQEFGASTPFLFFADHHAELAELVRSGRREFLSQFPSVRDAQHTLPDPAAAETFERSVLDDKERREHRAHYALHRDLIMLRRCDPALCLQDARIEGAVLGETAFVLRYFNDADDDRLLIVNLGPDLVLNVAPEPLLGPASGSSGWTRHWHSEDAKYGGRGAPEPESDNGSWRIPAESATLLAPASA